MAVDTARKRLAMLKVAGGWVPNRVFSPTGTVDSESRAELLGLYGGNDFDGPPALVDTEFNISSEIATTIKRRIGFEIINIGRDFP